MDIIYGTWGHRINVDNLSALVSENNHKEFNGLLKQLLNDIYSEGEYDGREDGKEEGLTSAEELADDWIGDGLHDLAVEKRAYELGYMKPSSPHYEVLEIKQSKHKELHPDGPYGWEFCSRC